MYLVQKSNYCITVFDVFFVIQFKRIHITHGIKKNFFKSR